MRHPNRKIFIALMLMFFFTASRPAHTYSYSAWTGMTGAKTLAINPFFYGSLSPLSGVSIDAVMALGLTARFDILADLVTINLYNPVTYGGSWLMPRFDLGGANIMALQIGKDTSSFYLIPQYHLFKENDKLAFEFNLGLKIPFINPLVMALSAIVAPAFKIIPNKFYLFIEADPSYTFSPSGNFSLNIVPGLCLLFGPNASNQICLGILLSNITGTLSPGFGIWYWHPFTF